jgi:YD repeat-containing protein
MDEAHGVTDADGQLTRKVNGSTTSAYTWDAQQTLASTTDTTTGSTPTIKTSSFTTGPDGSRWVRTTPTETVVYLDGQELHQAAGSSTTTAVRYYTQGDSTIAVRKAGTGAALTWALGDAQGSTTIAVSAAAGTLVRDRYLP